MPKSYVPKYQIGDKVIVGDDQEISEVTNLSFDGKEFRYSVTSRGIDIPRRKVIEGIKHAQESEMRVPSKKELAEDADNE